MNTSSHLRLGALALAKRYVGIHEVTDNDSPLIQLFLREAGIGVAAPWCAAFVQWCSDSASAVLSAGDSPVDNPLGDVRHEALVASYRNHAKAEGWVVDEPQPGDLFAIDFGGGRGHIGFVAGVRADGSIETVEGNTNVAGSREGTHVLERVRKPNSSYTFIRYCLPGDQVCPIT